MKLNFFLIFGFFFLEFLKIFQIKNFSICALFYIFECYYRVEMFNHHSTLYLEADDDDDDDDVDNY